MANPSKKKRREKKRKIDGERERKKQRKRDRLNSLLDRLHYQVTNPGTWQFWDLKEMN